MYKFSVQTYQLAIIVEQPVKIQVGKLGLYKFQKGFYVYTGSARRNIIARVTRHLSPAKKFHWHIDYFLAHKFVRVINVHFNSKPECNINQECSGEIPAPGFGSSDCINYCHSHLKFFPHNVTNDAAGMF